MLFFSCLFLIALSTPLIANPENEANKTISPEEQSSKSLVATLRRVQEVYRSLPLYVIYTIN